MAVAADLYVPGRTWVHAADPRVKLLFVACTLVLLVTYENLPFMLAMLVAVHLLYHGAHIPAHRLGFVWKALAPVCAFLWLLWVAFYPSGEPLLEIWVVSITPAAMAAGAVLALRVLVMGLAVIAWLSTTAQGDLVRGFVRLGAPFEWGLVLALALRYIPNILSTYTLIAEAQQARGLDVTGSGFRRVRRMFPILVAMIITSLRSSEALARALEARALGAPGVRRTTLHEIRFRASDYVLAAALLAFTAALLWLDLAGGIGAQVAALP